MLGLLSSRMIDLDEGQLLTSDAAGIWMMNDPTRKISVEAKVPCR